MTTLNGPMYLASSALVAVVLRKLTSDPTADYTVPSCTRDFQFFATTPAKEWSYENYVRHQQFGKDSSPSKKTMLPKFLRTLSNIACKKDIPDEVKAWITLLRDQANNDKNRNEEQRPTSVSNIIKVVNSPNTKVIQHGDYHAGPSKRKHEVLEGQRNTYATPLPAAVPGSSARPVANDVASSPLPTNANSPIDPVPDTNLADQTSEDAVVAGARAQADIRLPRYEDRLFNQGKDISYAFHQFQQFAQSQEKLTMESHVPHILSLLSILLIKPERSHPDLYKFLPRKEMEGLLDLIHRELHYGDIDYGEPPMNSECFEAIQSTILTIRRSAKKMIDRKNACQALFALWDMATPQEWKIILSLIALIQSLPATKKMEDVKEMELITRFVQPAIQPLFDDHDDGTLFRWTGTTNHEHKASISISGRRPDSCISSLLDLYVDNTRGFGEVKCESESRNHFMVARDLIRLACFSKNSLDVNHMFGVLSFQVIGKSRPPAHLSFFLGLQITFYFSYLAAEGIYIMIEIAHFTLPTSLLDLLVYVYDIDQLMTVTHLFQRCVPMTPAQQTEAANRRRVTMSTPEFDRIVDKTKDRKRRCYTSHYNELHYLVALPHRDLFFFFLLISIISACRLLVYAYPPPYLCLALCV
ncbi:hypothetical protein DM01DRAFT_1321839 [Hesseltinella vesiculosa]|uniref:Uncharacterized protein n=1 Tax=Hesseltinella vesiculosa TaxID=101127 RepID=A0A1X2GIC1_9FUNG|nr:hypothetical protein DM01DRAFT_1321839 [Hesseltinella vesiculosa]